MRGRSGWTVVAIATATLGFAGAAEAKTFEVTRANDPNPGKCKRNDCSLREAVQAANQRAGNDKIKLPSARRAYRLTIAGDTADDARDGDLDVANDALAIVHPGKGRATIRGIGLSDRLFDVFSGAPLRLSKLELTGGDVPAPNGNGGAIRAAARVVITRGAVTGNSTGELGGAIAADGPLSIVRSVVARNEATGQGGALYSTGSGPVRIERSTISGNRALGPAGTGGGISVEGAILTIVNSTIAGNRAVANGGGIYAADASDVDINAVTVARNIASSNSPGPPPITGGGIYMIDSTFDVRNSLLALNEVGQGGLVANDCEGETFTSLGNNLLSTKIECDGFTQPTDLERPNPKIGKLSRNGGPTKTIELKRGSPAVGNAHNPSAPNRDQRGRKRDNQPDIGAFERGA